MAAYREQPLLAASAIFALRQCAEQIEKWVQQNKITSSDVAVERSNVISILEQCLEYRSNSDMCMMEQDCPDCAPIYEVLYKQPLLRLVK